MHLRTCMYVGQLLCGIWLLIHEKPHTLNRLKRSVCVPVQSLCHVHIAPLLTLQVALAGSEFIFATKTEAEMIKWMQAICEAATVQVSAWE